MGLMKNPDPDTVTCQNAVIKSSTDILTIYDVRLYSSRLHPTWIIRKTAKGKGQGFL